VLEYTVWDDDREVLLKFEHSLLALSKWESRTKKPFMTKEHKSSEELIEYFQDMLVSPEDRRDLVYLLDPEQLDGLREYMNSNQSASTVPATKAEYNPEVITSELMYYWLVGLQIPFQPTETWHISRIMMLVQIASYKQQPPKKQKSADVMKDWARINEERLKKYNTTG
jgi:hypothetical protein